MGFLLILSDFFQVYSVSVLSAQITTKSHEPYYAMHGVNKFENLPENIQLQVKHRPVTISQQSALLFLIIFKCSQSTLFMQRISNTVVGLTILDSFVLTGGLISSVSCLAEIKILSIFYFNSKSFRRNSNQKKL